MSSLTEIILLAFMAQAYCQSEVSQYSDPVGEDLEEYKDARPEMEKIHEQALLRLMRQRELDPNYHYNTEGAELDKLFNSSLYDTPEVKQGILHPSEVKDVDEMLEKMFHRGTQVKTVQDLIEEERGDARYSFDREGEWSGLKQWKGLDYESQLPADKTDFPLISSAHLPGPGPFDGPTNPWATPFENQHLRFDHPVFKQRLSSSLLDSTTLGKAGHVAVPTTGKTSLVTMSLPHRAHLGVPQYSPHFSKPLQHFPSHGHPHYQLPLSQSMTFPANQPRALTSSAHRVGPNVAAEDTPHARLIFSRHGESDWNLKGIFTGWVDVDLSAKGIEEGKEAGELIKSEGYSVDVAFTSYLKRAIKTCNIALEAADQLEVPVFKSWRLNERMYGALTGLDKKETVKKHGPDQVQVWRRSYDVPPPVLDKDNEYHPSKEAKYKNVDPKDLPDTECLKDTIIRVMPYWEESIIPELKAGKTVLVAAHGNSIRAIVKYIEGMSDEVIPGLEIPTGTPLVYNLDKDLKPMPTDKAIEPLKYGFYLGDVEKIKAAAQKVKDQTKVAS